MAPLPAFPRRSFLACAASALAGCASAPAAPPPSPRSEAPPPFRVAELTDLLPLAHLRWLVQAKPREIATIPWLIPPIGVIAPEGNLDRFAGSIGFDLRQI